MRGVIATLVIILGTGCSAKVYAPVFEVSAALKAKVRVDATVSADGAAVVPVPPAPVPLKDAEVVEFFGVPLDGAQDIVFVLDRSGSMADPAQGAIAELVVVEPPPPPEPGVAPVVVDERAPQEPPPVQAAPQPRKIDVARAELLAALDQLPGETRLNVIFFNDGLEAYAPHVAVLDDGSRAGLVTFVRATEPVGSTALATAMRLAFVMKARRVVLLSDGLGNLGGNSAAVLRDAREAMLGGVRIDTIGLGVDQDRGLLDALARESGGLYQPL